MPPRPFSVFARAFPVSVSAKFEPFRFSIPFSVSPAAEPKKPSPSGEVHVDPRRRFRVGRRVDPGAADQDIRPYAAAQEIVAAEGRSAYSPGRFPVSVSAKFEPIRFSISNSVSPAAEPKKPSPVVRFTLTPAADSV